MSQVPVVTDPPSGLATRTTTPSNGGVGEVLQLTGGASKNPTANDTLFAPLPPSGLTAPDVARVLMTA
jgi:hypothetical protein